MTTDLFANYRALVAKVDALCERIAADQQEHLRCAPGCDRCCRHLTLLPVEAESIALYVRSLPQRLREQLRRQATEATDDGPCPLLQEGLCAIYAVRPIICRTHGLPIILDDGEGKRVDFCPENFQGVDSLPATATIDLERLNQILCTLNDLYLRECAGSAGRVRLGDLILRD